MTSLWSYKQDETLETQAKDFLLELQPSEDNWEELLQFFNSISNFQKRKSFVSKLLKRFKYFIKDDFEETSLQKINQEQLETYLKKIWDTVVSVQVQFDSFSGEKDSQKSEMAKEVDLSRVRFPDPMDYQKIEKYNEEF